MALAHRLDLKQTQGLVITPQLQQAIKLLQLSNLELDEVIEAELEKNPLLQREEAEREADREGEERVSDRDTTELSLDEGDHMVASEAMDAAKDDLYEPEMAHTADASQDSHDLPLTDWSRAGSGQAFEGEEDGFERMLVREKTLHEHLTEQLMMAHLNETDRLIATLLIDAVDEGGYVRTSLYEIAERLNCPVSRIEKVLLVCQGFDPVGIMARSLPECLKIQLIDKNRFDPFMAALLDHLEILAKRDMASLRQVCGVDQEDLNDMISELKSLNPRPGASFGKEPSHTVVPDVFVRPDQGGGWRIDLNSDTLPRLLIDHSYHTKVVTKARSDAEKTYFNECLNQASWLIKSLDQRARSILKVTAEIVRQQDAFFVYGVEYLRPLNLKTVADVVGLHESTVSRVTTNKYMHTPRGLYELKFFFKSAISSSDGESSLSSESVRYKIKSLIDAEKKSGEILSDDRIVEILKEAGVDIARRTVAKYREAMKIPSSIERKRQTL